jgi:hypothetical protein
MGILQTTGGKDEPNVVFMRNSYRTSQHGNQNNGHIIGQRQKTKKMSNTDPTKF